MVSFDYHYFSTLSLFFYILLSYYIVLIVAGCLDFFSKCGKVKINRCISKYSKSLSFSEALVPTPYALSNLWTSPSGWHPPWCGLNPLLQFYCLLSKDGQLHHTGLLAFLQTCHVFSCLQDSACCYFCPRLSPLSSLPAKILSIKFYSSTATSSQIIPGSSHHL